MYVHLMYADVISGRLFCTFQRCFRCVHIAKEVSKEKFEDHSWR